MIFKSMRIQKWWLVLMVAVCACKAHQEKHPAPGRESGKEKAAPSHRYNNTGMFLMDNGMILMFGADRPRKYKDSTWRHLAPIINQTERGGNENVHHKVP
ncbi:hypothetical protein [Taibaiella helva]|uniref:hypothetical protein n=1 Tax=Taibaiella helva TaxID=2301235 RepID=UPI000E595847|nr:hypothetical protein [Taibaiella helva]